MAEPHLRVIDGAGEVQLGDVVPSDYALLEEENRRLRRQLAAYKGQLARLAKTDPSAETVERLLVYWRNNLHGPDNTRVDISIDGKRGDVVRRTLKRLVENDPDPELANPDKAAHASALQAATERAEERIRNAIDGAKMFPYEGKYASRFSEAGPGRKRKADLLYILRDGPKMEAFEDLHEGDARRIAYAHDLHRRLTTQPGLREVFASLDPECGEILARAVRWVQALPGEPPAAGTTRSCE